MTARIPVLQRDVSQKDAIHAHAERLFEAAGVVFRPGRIARLVGRVLDREGAEAAILTVEAELEREQNRIVRPRLRNAIGVLDPTGQLAASRVDAERRAAAPARGDVG